VASKSGVLLDGSGLENPVGETNSASVQRLITFTSYDDFNEVTQQDQYDGDGVAMLSGNKPIDTAGGADGVPDAPCSNLLRARMSSSYDAQGRVWESQV